MASLQVASGCCICHAASVGSVRDPLNNVSVVSSTGLPFYNAYMYGTLYRGSGVDTYRYYVLYVYDTVIYRVQYKRNHAVTFGCNIGGICCRTFCAADANCVTGLKLFAICSKSLLQ